MSKEKTKSKSKVKDGKGKPQAAPVTPDKVLCGYFKNYRSTKKLISKQQSDLKKAGWDSKLGYILHAGRVSDGKFQVQFEAEGDGWSDRWPEWAYEPARDSLLHGKKVWVIYEGDMPFGPNLRQVLVLSSSV